MNLYQVYHRTSPPVRANTSLSSWSKVSSLNFGWSVKGRSHSVTDWVLYHQNNEDFNPDDDALIRETRFQHGGWTWKILWIFVTSTKKQNSILRNVLVSLALEVLQFVLDLLKHRNILTVCVITRSNEVKFQSQKWGYTQTSDLHLHCILLQEIL